MKLFASFGVGTQKLIRDNARTNAIVTSSKPCLWLKINKKAVRMHAIDGAEFTRVIRFSYNVNGTQYKGRRFMLPSSHIPEKGEHITVYYDKNNPAKYTVKA